MQLRFRYTKAGAHVRVVLFCAESPDKTYASCGTLLFTSAEFAWLQDHFSVDPNIEFVPFTKEVMPGE